MPVVEPAATLPENVPELVMFRLPPMTATPLPAVPPLIVPLFVMVKSVAEPPKTPKVTPEMLPELPTVALPVPLMLMPDEPAAVPVMSPESDS